MPNVYIVNMLASNNYDSAQSYGPPIYMTRGVLDLKKLEKIENVFRGYLKDADEENDYLCLSGSVVVTAIALKIWFENKNKCKLLHYQGSVYNLYTMTNP